MLTDVGRTFESHSILLAGGNGFLGKVVLGLLLDRFPGLQHLYILLRPKGGAGVPERFEREVLESPALAGVAAKRREVLRDKVTVVAGDVGEPGCGVSARDCERMKGRVGAVLNCAGLVEFYPPVDESFRSNVDGVRHVAELARLLGAKVAHVSTCFVCGEADGLVEETEPVLGFYPRRRGPEDASFRHEDEIGYCKERIRQVCQSGGEKEAGRRLSDLGRQRAEHWGWVNTYTYAKSLGEQVLAAEAGLEWTLIRPAIIEGSLRFPFPGWIEGGRTAAPLVLMARSGLRHWPVRRDAPIDVVPVDLVAAAMLVITALLLEGRQEPVYQLGTADVNPIRLQPLLEMLAADARFVSPEQARARRHRLQKRIVRAQNVLGGIRKSLDTAGLPGGQAVAGVSMSLRARSLQATLREQTLEQYLPFIHHNRYVFETENIRAAYAQITPPDRERLPWDPERIDWQDYWVNKQVPGIEKWIQPEVVREWTLRI